MVAKYVNSASLTASGNIYLAFDYDVNDIIDPETVTP